MSRLRSALLWACDGLWLAVRWQARVMPRVLLGYVGGLVTLSVLAVPVMASLRWRAGPALVAVAAGVGAWVSLRYAHRAWRVWRGR